MNALKVMHLADIHLGMENYGKVDKTTGFHSRLKDFIDTFDQAVDHALENQIDLVVFAGDAFKNRDPNPTQQREFAKRIKKLSNGGIKVVLLVGNHDLPNADSKAHSLEIYNTLEVDGVYVAKKPELLEIETRRGMVQVVTLPYASKSMLLKREEFKDLSLEEINNVIGEKITLTISTFARALKKDIPSILAAHLSVANAKVGSERSIMLGNELVLPISTLALPEFDYVALGHIHKHQVLKDNPPVVYSGSLDRIDFNEEHDPKGFVEVSLQKHNTVFEFIPLKTRPFKTLEFKVKKEDSTDTIIEKITTQNLQGAIVRIILEITPEDSERLNYNEIFKVVNHTAYFLSGIIKKWIKDTTLLRNPELTERILPIEALEKYLLEKKDLNLNKDQLITRARLLMEELKGEERGEGFDSGGTKA